MHFLELGLRSMLGAFAVVGRYFTHLRGFSWFGYFSQWGYFVLVLKISIIDLLLIQRNLFQALYCNKNADCKGWWISKYKGKRGKYWDKGKEGEFVQWRSPTCGFYLGNTLISFLQLDFLRWNGNVLTWELQRHQTPFLAVGRNGSAEAAKANAAGPLRDPAVWSAQPCLAVGFLQTPKSHLKFLFLTCLHCKDKESTVLVLVQLGFS